MWMWFRFIFERPCFSGNESEGVSLAKAVVQHTYQSPRLPVRPVDGHGDFLG